jgi:hypothetical protein
MVGCREEATGGLKRDRFFEDETEGISHVVMFVGREARE